MNYLSVGTERHERLAWAYLSPVVRALHDQQGAASFANTRRVLSIGVGSPLRNVTAPVTVDLSKEELDMVNLLIATEDELMEAFTELREVLASGQRLTPRKYAKKLRAFGRALQRFDRADHGQNSIFALFDAWIQESGQRAVRSASLTLRATIGERTVEKMLVTVAPSG
ncbi:MAG: hypothetical protein KC621_05700 [Myxococcales bacterium]|nr:hypothetical protein [Myxococcales bacterium]